MKNFRKAIFWTHLVAGLIAGPSIGVMCFTGTVLAFENELVEWAERDARRITPPADGARLPLDELQRKLREAQPKFRPAGLTLENDPKAAVAFSAGRGGGFYVNPYTGEVRAPASTKARDFMRLMTDWHRFLGREGDRRPLGKQINGICNLAFYALACTGLYLWWPRSWSWRGVKAIALFNWKLNGRARDFNWHNVIGLWSAPLLIVLTLTAVPISFRWGSNLIYQLVGEKPPAPQSAPASTAPAFEIKRPTPDAKPLARDIVLAGIKKDFSRWKQITLRSAPVQRRGPQQPPPSQNGGAMPSTSATAPATAEPREAAAGSENQRPKGPAPLHPLTVIIRESGSWPRSATTTLTLNPFTGEILKREGFGDFSTGRQIRTWTRFLHTGRALGWPGQLIAGLACLGGCFLVFTGFALSWRRFFGQRSQTAT